MKIELYNGRQGGKLVCQPLCLGAGLAWLLARTRLMLLRGFAR
jgi:hypothetical protein